MGVEKHDNAQHTLYEELLAYTTPNNAHDYTHVLSKRGIRSLYEVLNLDVNDLQAFSPHLRSVLMQARGEERSFFEGSPFGASIEQYMSSWVNIFFACVISYVAAYFLGLIDIFSFVEKIVSVTLLVVVMGLLLVRSFCLLLMAEDLGVLEVHRDYESSPTFEVTVTQLSNGVVTSSVTRRTTGENIGVVTHQIILSPVLNFIGLQSRLAWTAVVGIQESETKSELHTALSLTSVNSTTWKSLERLPWIPGVRAIQRSVTFKVAPPGAVYTVKKNASGQVWLEQGSALKKIH
ncbi:hypothetical protein DIPPA_65267 [Diplonema papillatum]|nr:hypothetical protein DIPPA_65267 [Diplonema papillatum]